jgi:hypothetical protein
MAEVVVEHARELTCTFVVATTNTDLRTVAIRGVVVATITSTKLAGK